MKSIPLALTWEFWRQSGVALFAIVAILAAQMVLLHGTLQFNRLYDWDAATLPGVDLFWFFYVVIHLAVAVCQTADSPRDRFTLPVSVRASILVPIINGAIATTIGYLAVALFVNWLFNGQWSLIKPAIIAVSMVSISQVVVWTLRCGSILIRNAIAAGVSVALSIAFNYLKGPFTSGQFDKDWDWNAIGPLDLSLAIVISTSACLICFVVLTLARRGQVFSMTATARWLLARLDIRFASGFHGTTPMAAELSSEWMLRGRPTLAGPILIAATLCGFFLSGRFEWGAGSGALAAFTGMQVMIGSVLMGLFVGHVGAQFDFHEHLATRPLSDAQLADVKLRNTLKSVFWAWITWTVGVAVAVLCLMLVGQGPKSWSDVVPSNISLFQVISVVMVPLCSWTLTSLAVSVVILRPWMVKTVFSTLALLPAVPFGILYLLPESENEIFAASQWSWICLSIGGTIALYVTTFRLRLITVERIAVVGVSYVLCCATWLSLSKFLPPLDIPRPLAVGIVLSTCMLPFVCVAAVPLAVWWNRHR